MADLLTDTASVFIKTKTTLLSPDESSTSMSECPICFDDEPLLQITGVLGCNHSFGIGCLKAILSSHPGTEKKCPLCRTIWIHASLLGPFSSIRPQDNAARAWAMGLSVAARGEQDNVIILDDDDEEGNDTEMRHLRPSRFSARNNARRGDRGAAHHRVPLGSADEGNGVTEESFDQFNRDIADIRRLAPHDRPGRRLTGSMVTHRRLGNFRARFNDHRMGSLGSRPRAAGQIQNQQDGSDGRGPTGSRTEAQQNDENGARNPLPRDNFPTFLSERMGLPRDGVFSDARNGVNEDISPSASSPESLSHIMSDQNAVEVNGGGGRNASVQVNLSYDPEGERNYQLPLPQPARSSLMILDSGRRTISNGNSQQIQAYVQRLQRVETRENEVAERERKVIAREIAVAANEQRVQRLLNMMTRQSDEQTQMIERQRRELLTLRGSLR